MCQYIIYRLHPMDASTAACSPTKSRVKFMSFVAVLYKTGSEAAQPARITVHILSRSGFEGHMRETWELGTLVRVSLFGRGTMEARLASRAGEKCGFVFVQTSTGADVQGLPAGPPNASPASHPSAYDRPLHELPELHAQLSRREKVTVILTTTAALWGIIVFFIFLIII